MREQIKKINFNDQHKDVVYEGEEDFLQRQKNHLERKKQKIESKKQQQEAERKKIDKECTFKPKINQYDKFRSVDDLLTFKQRKENRLKAERNKQKNQYVDKKKTKPLNDDIHINNRFVQLEVDDYNRATVSDLDFDPNSVVDRLYSYHTVYTQKRFNNEKKVYKTNLTNILDSKSVDTKAKGRSNGQHSAIVKKNNVLISQANVQTGNQLLSGFINVPIKQRAGPIYSTARMQKPTNNSRDASVEMNKTYNYITSKSPQNRPKNLNSTVTRTQKKQKPLATYIHNVKKGIK